MNRILVIEDDQTVRGNIVELLIEEGFEIFEAENGKTGIEKAKKEIPDLIISDILMPEADGFEVLHELQKELVTASIPFIFLTAQNNDTDVRLGMREGADDYLTKPYKAVDLLDAVNARLSKKKKIDLKTNELLKSISTTLPHEFRTPLVAILGYSSIMKEDFDTIEKGEIAEMAGHINSAGNDLLGLIEHFLAYTDLETILASKEKVSKFHNATTSSIANDLGLITLRTAVKNERESDLFLDLKDASINIHKDHFDLIVKEILDNAFKFSKKGNQVEVKSVIANDKFILSFTDYGKGMSPEQIKEIGLLRQFDKVKNNQTGVGLGLSIVHKIAEIYDLDIKIESEQRKFTSVEVAFPIKAANLLEKEATK
jgi:two-component system sensor histidine kinase/response regulator